MQTIVIMERPYTKHVVSRESMNYKLKTFIVNWKDNGDFKNRGITQVSNDWLLSSHQKSWAQQCAPMTTTLVEVLGTCWTPSVASTVSSMFNKETLSPKLRWRTTEDSQCLPLAWTYVHAGRCTSTHVHTCMHPPNPKELLGFCYLEPEAKESETLEMSPLSIFAFNQVETGLW